MPGTANSKENFDLAWASLVKEMVTVSTAPEMQPPVTEDGWEVQSGYAPFESDGNKGVVILATSTGFEKMVNIIILTNTDEYEKNVTDFLESINFEKQSPAANTPVTNPVKPKQANTVAKKDGFTFTTTNFDDGWTSTVQEDWVEVKKEADYSSDPLSKGRNHFSCRSRAAYQCGLEYFSGPPLQQTERLQDDLYQCL